MVARLIKDGAKVNKETYVDPMTNKISNAGTYNQQEIVKQAIQLKLPYAAPDIKKLRESWENENKHAANKEARDELVKKQATIELMLQQWKDPDSKKQGAPKPEISYAPIITPDFTAEANPSGLPASLRGSRAAKG